MSYDEFLKVHPELNGYSEDMKTEAYEMYLDSLSTGLLLIEQDID